LTFVSLSRLASFLPPSCSHSSSTSRGKGKGEAIRGGIHHSTKGSTATPQHGNTRSMQAASGNKITSAMEARGCRRKGWQEKAGDGVTSRTRLTYRRALYVQKQAQKRSGAKESRSNGKWEEMGGWKEEKFRRGRVARYIMYRETRPLSFSPCCAADVDSFEAVSISGGG
jgi:hypothetical protein